MYASGETTPPGMRVRIMSWWCLSRPRARASLLRARSGRVVIPNVGIEHEVRRMLGETPGQDVRSATEAAGAANVVDGAPPGERGQRSKGWTTHRRRSVLKNWLCCCDPVAAAKPIFQYASP